MNVLNLPVSYIEKQVLEAIEEIGYGELYDIQRDPAGYRNARFPVEISPKTANFIRFIRQGLGPCKVIVHDSEPTAAEYEDKTKSGIRCLKKIRF